MEKYTREWLTFHLLKIRDMFWSTSARDWDDLPGLIRNVGDAIIQITGMSRDEMADLVADKLMNSEAERQAFFSKYNVPSAFDSICSQMQASA